MTSKGSFSSRVRILVSFAVFASTALLLLTGPSPAAAFALLQGTGTGAWSDLGHRELVFSLIADGLAWLACVVAAVMLIRLAKQVRERVPFGLTTYILLLFIVCFGVQRILGYLVWAPAQRLHMGLQVVRATASVIVAIGAAVLFPYVRSMVRAVIAATKEHEQFVAAAESSLDAFYIFESVRDEAKKIVDFRFSLCECERGEAPAEGAAGADRG